MIDEFRNLLQEISEGNAAAALLLIMKKNKAPSPKKEVIILNWKAGSEPTLFQRKPKIELLIAVIS